MASQEILSSISDFVAILTRITHDHVGVDQSERGGIAVRWAESSLPFWNALFLTELLDNGDQLAECLLRGATYMRSKQQKGSLYLCLDALSGDAREMYETIAHRAGLKEDYAASGMLASTLPKVPHEHSSGSQLTFHRVAEETGLQIFADLTSLANGFPISAGRSAFQRSRFWTEEAFTFVGSFGGKPVCCAAVTANQNSLYVSLVATHPGSERRGFASAVVRHALSEANLHTGIKRSVLHASMAGARVYERLGFFQVARFSALRLAN